MEYSPNIEKKPFINYTLDEDKIKSSETVNLKINPQERAWLDNMKKVLEQSKDSTAIKQLALIGSKVLLEEKTAYILGVVFDNKRKNKRLGIIEYEA
jgi:hypothetical protein